MTQNGSAQRPATDGDKGRQLNWPATVSALATSVAAVVALIAYLAPPGQSTGTKTPSPSPSESQYSPSPDRETSRPPSDPPPPDPETTRADPVTSVVLPPVPPIGCAEATAALNAYSRNAGDTRSSHAGAAQQAYSELMGVALNAQGAVGQKVTRLAREFQELNFRLTGMVMDDPNEVLTDIRTDIAELNRLCTPA
ncbi:hypothetical protein ACBI99_36185 [Nonomuraea sp. ATR24]|uniref:hypothetical protein n=1 Tax=Nonomuraea sp. ATR24 TaxID=1676744 RepID=UPI0035C121E6